MRERHQRPTLVEEGVSLYDRERVEDVGFMPQYKLLVDVAMRVFDSNHQPKYLSKFYPNHKKPEQEAPFALVLPAGEDPHEPVKHLARACVDANQGYGFAAVASLDMTKAARLERATDLAINRLRSYKKGGLVGAVLVVMQHEDSASSLVTGLLEDMAEHGMTDELPDEEAARQARVQRLLESVDKLALPKLTLMTMESYETPPVFEDEPVDPNLDAGTRLY